jgi:hypothetical protein
MPGHRADGAGPWCAFAHPCRRYEPGAGWTLSSYGGTAGMLTVVALVLPLGLETSAGAAALGVARIPDRERASALAWASA